MGNAKKAALGALLGAALMGGWSSASLAQMRRGPDSGFYVGGALGQAEYRDACAGLPSGASCDDKDVAWKIFGGWQLNRHFAAEIGYANLGEISASSGGLDDTLESTALDLVGIGAYAFPEGFTLYGKVGLYRADTEARSGVGLSASETNSGLTFGAGGRYDFNRNVGVRVEWQRYSDVGGGDINEIDVDVVSVGVIWKF